MTNTNNTEKNTTFYTREGIFNDTNKLLKQAEYDNLKNNFSKSKVNYSKIENNIFLAKARAGLIYHNVSHAIVDDITKHILKYGPICEDARDEFEIYCDLYNDCDDKVYYVLNDNDFMLIQIYINEKIKLGL